MTHYSPSETRLREIKALTLYVILDRDMGEFYKEVYASTDVTMLEILLTILTLRNPHREAKTIELNVFGAAIVRVRLAALTPAATS